MVHAKLFFEDGQDVYVCLAARPLVGEFIVFNEDRFRVKDVTHIATPIDAQDLSPMVVVKLGIGRKGSHRHLLESSPKGFYTGSD
ncbi:hypothetical protein CFI10_13795 [Marinobacterium iners]|uniref:hypothetical protein n=1 Tax=Marinobacterium TaxID=48075 RepID=UPI001A8CB67A|nr:hypothetical protein [Marinobacterium iners]QSR36054.1 hypothetical protein CFI10_13795 [Marinobacterium iners]